MRSTLSVCLFALVLALLGSACSGDQTSGELTVVTAASGGPADEEGTGATRALRGEVTDGGAVTVTSGDPTPTTQAEDGAVTVRSGDVTSTTQAGLEATAESTAADTAGADPEKPPGSAGASFTPAVAFVRAFGGGGLADGCRRF